MSFGHDGTASYYNLSQGLDWCMSARSYVHLLCNPIQVGIKFDRVHLVPEGKGYIQPVCWTLVVYPSLHMSITLLVQDIIISAGLAGRKVMFINSSPEGFVITFSFRI